MLTSFPDEKNKSIILELSSANEGGIIGGYCEEEFPIYYANKKIAQMLGYSTVEELVKGIDGKVSNTIHPDDRKKVTKDLNNGNFYEGMTYKTIYRMPKKDGSWFWTVDKGKVIRAEDGRLAIISICNDMSGFIDQCTELEKQNNLSKITLENMPGGYHRCAMTEGFPIIYITDRFLKLFGWTKQELKTEFNNKFLNMIHPNDRKLISAYIERIKNSFGTDVIADEIFRMRGKNGYIWVSDATSLVKADSGTYFYQGTITDITNFVVNKEKGERELKISNRKLEHIQKAISTSGMGVWHIKLIDGKVPRMHADAHMLELLGISGQKLTESEVYNAWFSNITKESIPSVLKSIEKMKRGEKDENTYLWNHPALGTRYVRCGGTAQKVQGGFILSGYHYDVDDIVREQKRQEEILAETLAIEKQHSEVISALSTIYTTIFRVDLDTHNYSILTSVPLMKTVAKTNGIFDDVAEAILNSFISQEMKNQMRSFLNLNTLSQRLKKINTIVTEYKNPAGRWFQARFIVKKRDENGIAREALYVARDFTEEKHNDLLQQERLEALSNDYTAVYSCDLLKDTMTPMKIKETSHIFQNREHANSFSQWTKYSYENIIIKESMPDYLEKFDRKYLMTYLKENKMFISRHQTKPNKAGFEYFEVRVVPYYCDEDSFLVMLAFRSIDAIIEKEKKQQEQLSVLLAAAEQSSKAKTTFLNSMSHDIRTPMNAIIGFTALAQTHIDNKMQVQDYLSKISTSSTHLLSLINDILDMSRIESGSVKLEEKPVHIPDLLHDLRIMIQGLINSKNQNLYIDTQDVHHEDVITDKLRLNQVLINIVGNAIKYTQPGGNIMIRLVEKPCSIKHYTTYEFSVKDNGIGMSKDFISHIFDTFSREYSSTVSGIQGTGLGMSITKHIVVDMMGGTIDVQSEEGKGSLFTVTINVRLANEPVKTEPIPELKGARALVIDDDIDTCRSVCKMLRTIEMRPDWTSSGKEAVLRAQDATELKDEYKVYIVDYLMPDMNGIEVVRRIRKVIGEDVPIIVLTAYDWADFEHEAREAGVTAFVAKPIFMSELRAVLTKPQMSLPNSTSHKEKTFDYHDKRVLLAEDNKLNQEIATALLEETGMTIDCVSDGIEAVETINSNPADKYDLILMDIQMPIMDGYTATREIRTLKDNKKANIPIVAMTANAFDEDRKKALENGMNGHIIKPISLEEIAKVLDQIFQK